MEARKGISCPCCGGAVTFDSRLQKMKCPYCDTEFEMDALLAYEQEQIQEEREPDWDSVEPERKRLEEGDLVSYVCEACGGEIVADRTMAASRCPYCDNPVLVPGRLEGVYRPDLVIPFRLGRDEAKACLQRQLKGKLLLPRAFRAEGKLEEVKGVYVPFWLFDCDARANLRYRATRIRSWRSGDYSYTETSHYLAVREGELSFDRVPADGLAKMEDGLMESLEPYRYEEAVDFSTAYLAGYLADKYDVPSRDCYARVNERIAKSTQRAFAATMAGYATYLPQKKEIRIRQGKIRYALLPVWLLHTNYRGKRYTFAVNGQTGKFVGELPMSRKRAAAVGAGTFLTVSLAVFLLLTAFL